MKPPRSILDKSFHYTPAAQSDIRQRFRRIRRQLLEEARRKEAEAAERASTVQPIKRRA
jgi:hypothetical protein